MDSPLTIQSLEIENTKRVKAVSLTPSKDGLTVIGGKNGNGKTSVLDSIVWALGGDKHRPSNPKNDACVGDPLIHIELSNGIVVERRGKNSDLKVIDPSGNKAGQKLLSEFVDELALNLPKFLEANNKEKARVLLDTLGIGDKLYELDKEEEELYNTRRSIGQLRDQKKAAADEMPRYEGVPDEPVSASELISQQQEILAQNGENQRLRHRAQELAGEYAQITAQIEELRERQEKLLVELETANKTAEELVDESTEELELSIKSADEINEKVRVNRRKADALEEAEALDNRYKEITSNIEKIRQDRMRLLDGADLPLENLSIENGELTYNGFKWDAMSGSEQLKVSTAIVRKIKPQCGFVLLDKLEQMDIDTLSEFNEWASNEGLQIIATRVSTGDECSVIIEDGRVKEQPVKFVAGEF